MLFRLQKDFHRRKALLGGIGLDRRTIQRCKGETSFCVIVRVTVSSKSRLRSPLSVNRRFRFCKNVESSRGAVSKSSFTNQRNTGLPVSSRTNVRSEMTPCRYPSTSANNKCFGGIDGRPLSA